MTAAVKGPWFNVPAGTPEAECRSCHATVYWITTANGKRMPVDCEVEGAYGPDTSRDSALVQDGHGVSHFATCPEGNKWRQR